MKRLLARVNTKKELTEYLAIKTLEKGREEDLRVTVAWDSRGSDLTSSTTTFSPIFKQFDWLIR